MYGDCLMSCRCCGCLFPICGHQWGVAAPSGGGGAGSGDGKHDRATDSDAFDAEAVDHSHSHHKQGNRTNVDKLRGPERFFHSWWYPLLKRRVVRFSVILGLTATAITGVVLAFRMVEVTRKSTSEAILKKSHPLQLTFDLLRGVHPAFKEADDASKQVGRLAYGLDIKTPVNRSGTNPLGNGPNGDEQSFEDGAGVAIYNGQDLTSEAFQNKVVADCEDLGKLKSVFRSKEGDAGEGEVFCFMRDFKAYVESSGGVFPVASDVLVDELLKWRKNATCTGQGCYWTLKGTGVSQGRDDRGLYDKVTGFHAEVGSDDKKKIKFCYIGANVTVPKADLDLAKIVPQYEEFRDAAVEENKKDSNVGVDAVAATGNAMWIANMNALVECVVQAIPSSVGLAFVVLTVTTGNWMVAGFATTTITGIMGCFFLTFVLQGLTLGVYESMFLSLTAGFAVDYVVHLAHAYNEALSEDRMGKMQESLTAMGVSVLSGAISTLMASFMLFVCSFNFFSTYGGFIFFVIFWSLVWATCFFPAIMMTVGPCGASGDINFIRRLQGHGPRPSALPSTAPTTPVPCSLSGDLVVGKDVPSSQEGGSRTLAPGQTATDGASSPGGGQKCEASGDVQVVDFGGRVRGELEEGPVTVAQDPLFRKEEVGGTGGEQMGREGEAPKSAAEPAGAMRPDGTRNVEEEAGEDGIWDIITSPLTAVNCLNAPGTVVANSDPPKS